MQTKTKASDLDQINKDELVSKLKKEAIIANFGRLLTVLINLLANEKSLEKLGKREGQEIQINFPAYDIENNCITFVLSKTPSDPYIKPSENPKAVITFNVKEDNLIPMLVDIITTKYGILGLLKLVFKYMLTRRIKFKPLKSLGAIIALMRCFLIGNHDVFKRPKKTMEEV